MVILKRIVLKIGLLIIILDRFNKLHLLILKKHDQNSHFRDNIFDLSKDVRKINAEF